MNAIEIPFADRMYLSASGDSRQVPVEIFWKPDGPVCSVIIPCFNYGRYLPEAVQSVLDQTLKSVEIIVVDDGSTDAETLDVLRSMVGDRRVRILLKPNEGLPEARNAGIRTACGKYICCLDADDVLHPSYLEHCVYELECDGARGMVYSWVRLFGDENYVWQTRDFDLDEALVDNHTSVAALFRKTDWLLTGGYDRRMFGGYEDWEFWLRLAQLGRKGYAIKAPLFFHRRHGRTMTHDAHDKRRLLIDRKRELNHRLFTDISWRKMVAASMQISDLRNPSLLEDRQKIAGRRGLLCVLPWLKPGGAEILMLDVLRALREDFEITVITTAEDDHQLLPQFRLISNDIFHYPVGQGVDTFIDFIAYLGKTRNASDILTSGSLMMYEALPRLSADGRMKFRVVDLLHNDSELGYLAKSIKYSDHLVGTIGVSSRVISSLIEGGIDKTKLICIPNGVDGTHLFTPAFSSGRVAGKSIPTVGFVGRAASEKRPLLFVDLFTRVSKEVEVQGLMVCSGPMSGEIESRINDYGLKNLRVIPETERAALPDFYREFDILVNVSSIEGMPLTIIEALACGCPVAAMEVGNLRDVIDDGQNGILVGRDQLDKLAQALIDYFKRPQDIPSFKARARASFERNGYDADHMLLAYKSYLGKCYSEVTPND